MDELRTSPPTLDSLALPRNAKPESPRRRHRPIAYARRTGVWTLYWRDRNQRWHPYEPVGPSARIDVLLEELDRDTTAIFWG